VLELAGRLGSPGELPVQAARPGNGTPAPPWREQVRAGLVSLGWQAREADQAIAAVEPELSGEPSDGQAVDVSVALRAALRVLGRT
jgi:Holliday junction DNA helicase RuvA